MLSFVFTTACCSQELDSQTRISVAICSLRFLHVVANFELHWVSATIKAVQQVEVAVRICFRQELVHSGILSSFSVPA